MRSFARQGLPGRELAFAGTETGVFQSVNGGRTWRETGFDATDAPVQAIAWTSAGDTLIAGTGGAGIFGSTMGTGTWRAIGADLPANNVIALHVIEDANLAPAIMAVFDTGVAVSLDGGDAWRFTDSALEPDDSIVTSCLLGHSRVEARLAIGLASGDIRFIPDIVVNERRK